MDEIIFLISEDPDGGYIAEAVGESIFTQADDLERLREMIRDAVRCHFPEERYRLRQLHLQVVCRIHPLPHEKRSHFIGVRA